MPTWDERYAGESFLFGTEPNVFLTRHKERLPTHGTALAVADGEGRNGVWLAEQGLDVLAVDGSEVALAKSRKLAAKRGVAMHYEHADLSAWDFGQQRFDVIAAIFIQFAEPDFRARLFASMVAALKPAGLLLLEGYRPEQLAYGTGGPPQAENMYTEPMLREAFADLTIEHLASYDEELHEGRHEGMSALIDLVARKPE
ncbi:class I SAM-dependent methyltransferase [Oleiagrimonas sp.]|jgi:SAM-dependent methyltransferase|uniref:class I SAM-dependent methyltransferase n=1 Tax=Oleiagrimonas sp. TaxID=2010330 RepID=UPI00261D9EB7|nr:class I SAM-dependent methyltransferase [Oleiagrimonas sp.]MDA3913789.1 class I SAM-dependent methyltransferase [Oleiagrimonas sp.]